MLYFLSTLACLSLASGRTIRPRLPGGISHSIVNLGKMDFNVYMNSKPESLKSEYGLALPKPRILNSEPTRCPCQQNSKDQDEEDFIVDLFSGVGPSRFKETKSSVLCCTSEETQEDLFLEIKTHAQPFLPMRQIFPPIPQRMQPKSRVSTIFPPMPAQFQPMSHNVPPLTIFPFGDIFPGKVHLTGTGKIFLDDRPGKGKRPFPEFKKIEMFVEPATETRTTSMEMTTTATIKPDIKAVGEKMTTMLYDFMSTNLSVKKDLTQDNSGHFIDVESIIIPKPTGTFNQSNTL